MRSMMMLAIFLSSAALAAETDAPYQAQLKHILIAEKGGKDVDGGLLIGYITAVRDTWLRTVELELEHQLEEKGRLGTTTEVDAAVQTLKCAEKTTIEFLYSAAKHEAVDSPDEPIAKYVVEVLELRCGSVR